MATKRRLNESKSYVEYCTSSVNSPCVRLALRTRYTKSAQNLPFNGSKSVRMINPFDFCNYVVTIFAKKLHARIRNVRRVRVVYKNQLTLASWAS